MSFKGAEWDSDALGNVCNELFEKKDLIKNLKSSIKEQNELKRSISRLSKKHRNSLEKNSKSNNTKPNEKSKMLEITKSKKKRLKIIRKKQERQSINIVKTKDCEGEKNNRNEVQVEISGDKGEKKKHNNKTILNSGPMKNEHSKAKKKYRNLKKRLETTMQHGTFINQVNITDEEVLIKNDSNKKPIVALSKSSKKILNFDHQTKAVNKKKKFFEKLKQTLAKPMDKKPQLTLRQKMLDKLKAARFRFLNEQIYTTNSKEAQKIFQSDPDAFQAYHEGYRKQVKRWPMNPLDVIIKSIKTMPKSYVIADFGCGDAKLSKTVKQKVFSFDLVATDETVVACDISRVPLENSSVDIVVFCLSLMGTNLNEYILEANRVLKTGGTLKIAEVESRFENIEEFIKWVQHYGFKNTWKDLSHDLFYFMDFRKDNNVKNRKKLPTLSLLPCLYKKR
ncbi:uncharacterized protein isoform X2 [Leptinotarsa decemlineata]|uniref:uncharacterized protein isoform X2 n=1 Tax=Leptinotarsa decemlineata TaxID=7539 RepID=UPI000C2532B3|nr:ribosomal RNA-processing protein 8 isoform X2 [Leptinotarsa decemlineata]